MADNGRQTTLGQLSQRFSHVDAGPAGREVRPASGATWQPTPGAGSHDLGLAEIYADTRPAERWGGDSAGLTASEPKYSWIFDGIDPARGAGRPQVGPYADAGNPARVGPSSGPADLGSSSEMDWSGAPVFLWLTAMAALCWALIKRHPIPVVLWGLVLLVWALPH